jgi:addiction module RelE/StbE family toxin
MIMINQSIHFNRSLKKWARKKPEIIPAIVEKILLFSIDKNTPSLALHKLSGTLKEHWAFSIEYNLRIIFRYTNDGNILFVDIGSHDEVY